MSNPKDYTVGWICAISTEYVAAQAFLDEEHELPEHVSPNDNNDYTLGKIGKHNVVIAVLPEGEYGTSSAASVARDMLNSFPNVRIGLMVGIGGGAPSRKHNIRLGDIVVSAIGNGKGGVFQYDFGKTIQGQNFQETGFLNQPPTLLRTAVSGLKAQYERKGHQIEGAINSILEKNPRLRQKYKRPELDSDRLYHAGFTHPLNDDSNCAVACGDDPSNLTFRPERTEYEDNPAIHYGLIASANQLMKDALVRDRIAAEKDVLCFEMEAAGLMNHFPCLVIRGICDYSDSHKNKEWQGYAAMAAAAYAKDLLCRIPPNKVETEKRLSDIVSGVRDTVDRMEKSQKDERVRELLDWLSPPSARSRHNDVSSKRVQGTGRWILDDTRFKEWQSAEPKSRVLCCFGEPGAGKTYIASLVIDTLRQDLENRSPNTGLGYIYCDYRDRDQTTERLIAAIVKQLLLQLDVIPDRVCEIYNRHRKQGTQIPLYEAEEMLRLACAAFSGVYICVDALDELQERGRLLSSLQKTHPSVRFFFTGRDHVTTTVEDNFDECEMLQIRASEGDVRSLIKDKITKSPKEIRGLIDSSLEQKITQRIIARSAENFLFSTSMIEYVLDADTRSKCLEHLDSLPKSVSEAFGATIQRIEQQPESKKQRGMQILTWVYKAERQLSVEELLYALAIEPNHSDLDRNNFVNRETFLGSCLGLVIIDEESSTVRLVHKSLQEYLDTRGDLFENGHAIIARTCLTYLMFQSVIRHSEDTANTAEYPKVVPNDLALVDYAACEWGHHLRKSGQKEDLVDLAQRYLSMDLPKRDWSQRHLWQRIQRQDPVPVKSIDRATFSILHITAYFGTHLVLSKILSATADLDCMDIVRRSPLWWASFHGHEDTVALLLQKGAQPNLDDSQTPLTGAIEGRRAAVVELLLEKGAEVDYRYLSKSEFFGPLPRPSFWRSRSWCGRTPLSRAAELGDEKIVNLLLQYNARPELEDEGGRTPLSRARRGGNDAVVKLLEKAAKDRDNAGAVGYGRGPGTGSHEP